MNDIPGFWKDGPNQIIPVEASWQEFIRSIGETVLEDVLPQHKNFENADFAFFNSSVIAELKEIETEFSHSSAFRVGFDKLMTKLLAENPDFRPALFGGDGIYPAWFMPEYIRLFRPPLSRILKKANRQIRETKAHYSINNPTGILLLANDGFTSIGPGLIRSLASQLLTNSYSSIDCCIYLTVNRYIEIAGSDEPKLLWAPVYSDRTNQDLVEFVNNLGRSWFNYLESKVGPFTSRMEIAQNSDILRGARAIILPHESG